MKKFWYLLPALCAVAAAGWYGVTDCSNTCLQSAGNQKTAAAKVPAQQEQWLAAVQQDIASSEYHIRYQEAAKAYQSPNRAQNLRVTYRADGFSLTPRIGSQKDWNATLRLQSISKGGRAFVPANNPEFVGKENTLTAIHPAFTMEFVNSPEGMRQNFVVREKPEGAAPLTVAMLAESDMTPEITDNGSAVVFRENGTPMVEYQDLKVWDAVGTRLKAEMRLNGNALSIVVDDGNAVYPVTIDPLSTSPNWSAEGDQDGALFGYKFSTAGDVNRDNYADFMVGSPNYDNGEADEGAVFIYHGSVSGLSSTVARMLESNQAGAHFGFSLANAGDVNGDNYSDIVIGAPDYDNGEINEGRISIYTGSSSGIPATAAITRESDQAGAQFGYSVSSAGRINADLLSDIIVGAPYYDNGETDEGRAFVFWGDAATTLSSTAPWTAESQQVDARMGMTVAGNGDFNRDGRSDISIGIPLFDNGQTNEGTVYTYYGIFTGGLPASPNWIREGNQNDAQYGFSVAVAGDVNGDGFSELLIGSPFWSGGESNEGRALLYRGNATGLDTTAVWTGEGNQINARFGQCVASAGDVNNDGNDDIIIGAPLYDAGETDEGRASLYIGSTAGLVPFPNWVADGNQNNAQFGTCVAGIGDINRDGFDDFATSAPYYDNENVDEGRVFAYYGAGSGIGSALAVLEPNSDNARFGTSVASAGDVNGDGFSDLIVGAPGFDGGSPGEGKVFLYYGSATGFSSPSVWNFESNQIGAALGTAVSTAGDVNGDNFSDIAVSAPMWDSIETNEGRVWVFYGTPAGLPAVANRIIESNQTEARFGTAVVCAGDVNNNGFSDLAVGAPFYDNGQQDEGQVFLYSGSATGLGAAAVWTAEGNRSFGSFGAAIANANDVNGDGFADMIIGAPTYNNDADTAAEGTIFAFYGRANWPQLTPNWQEATDQDAARYGASVSSAGDVNGDGYTDVIVGAPLFDNGQTDEGRVVVYYGGVNGMQSANVWLSEINLAGSLFGTSVSGGGDINGDGYADIIIGAPRFTAGQNNEGGMFVYNGGANGISTTASFTAESDQVDAAFGTSVANLGDVNGDGYSDVAVGAPAFDNGNTDEGRTYVFPGRSNGLSATPTESLLGGVAFGQFGVVVAPAGDVNGDGYADVIVSSPYYDGTAFDEGAVWVYYGNANGLGSTNPTLLAPTKHEKAYFGWAAASAGDVNNDGFADIVVGAPGYDFRFGLNYDQGRVYIFHGSATGINSTPVQMIDGVQSQEQIGLAVAGVGDVNNDGYSDVAVGTNRYDGQFTDEGKVTIYYGSSAGTTTVEPWIKTGGQEGAYFGFSVASAGDVNRDGLGDVIIGAYNRDKLPLSNNGEAYVFLGATGGLSQTPATTITGAQDGELLGYTVASAGDVNGDGFGDVLITSLWYDSGEANEGRVWLFHGTSSGISSTPVWYVDGNQIAPNFGASLAAAGDVNGDGYGDVIIGAESFDNGNIDEGRAVVYFGSDTSLLDNPAWIAEPDQNYAYTGGSVAGAGDVNGDGYPDLIVGARGFDAGLSDRGAATVFYGNAAAGKRATTRQWRPGTPINIVPVLRSQNNLSVDFGLWGRTTMGRADVKAEFEAKAASVPFNGSGIVSGTNWTDIGTAGAEIVQRAAGLTNNVAYKWRGRLHNRMSEGAVQRYSRWYSLGYNSPTEADFRTGLVCTIQANAGDNINMCKGNGRVIGKAASGAVGTVTYSWSPARGLSAVNVPTPFANPDSTTRYIVTAIDGNACLSRDTITITVLPNVTISAGNDISICPGDTARLDAKVGGGTPGFTYEWTPTTFLSATNVPSPAAKPPATITYTVMVSDNNGCVARDTIIVRVMPTPAVPAITRSIDTLICIVPAVKYQWYVDGQPITGATGQRYLFQQTVGTKFYRVETTDQNGCRASSNTIQITILVGVEEEIAAGGLSVYPIPANDEITLRASLDTPAPVRVVITNTLGEVVASFDDGVQSGGYSRRVSLEHLAAGSYIVTVRAGDKHWLRTFIKE